MNSWSYSLESSQLIICKVWLVVVKRSIIEATLLANTLCVFELGLSTASHVGNILAKLGALSRALRLLPIRQLVVSVILYSVASGTQVGHLLVHEANILLE